jgi:transposase-like protein
VTCPACGGTAGLLGVLGRLRWYVCRACGMQFSRRTKGGAL